MDYFEYFTLPKYRDGSMRNCLVSTNDYMVRLHPSAIMWFAINDLRSAVLANRFPVTINWSQTCSERLATMLIDYISSEGCQQELFGDGGGNNPDLHWCRWTVVKAEDFKVVHVCWHGDRWMHGPYELITKHLVKQMFHIKSLGKKR